LLYFFNREGLHNSGMIRLNGKIEPTRSLLATFHSPYLLDHVISRLLEYSNNFIANQILLAVGAHVFGPPATLAKGLQAVTRFADRQLNLSGFSMTEGSGISRANRLSANQMIEVLRAFAPYRYLLRRDGSDFYKTGTLNGIRTRAGYIETTRGQWYSYVIFINTPGKTIAPIIGKIKKMVENP
jgi:D-alanyl-D-alanine carboxypeptidase/D-alanyl-D-alanine-endopeptidase (penicillin-binding protein 4)